MNIIYKGKIDLLLFKKNKTVNKVDNEKANELHTSATVCGAEH